MGKTAVYGIATSHFQAEEVVRQLQSSGFSPNDVSALFPDKEGTRDFAHEQQTQGGQRQALEECHRIILPRRNSLAILRAFHELWPLASASVE